jgi:hypothetical protein
MVGFALNGNCAELRGYGDGDLKGLLNCAAQTDSAEVNVISAAFKFPVWP